MRAARPYPSSRVTSASASRVKPRRTPAPKRAAFRALAHGGRALRCRRGSATAQRPRLAGAWESRIEERGRAQRGLVPVPGPRCAACRTPVCASGVPFVRGVRVASPHPPFRGIAVRCGVSAAGRCAKTALRLRVSPRSWWSRSRGWGAELSRHVSRHGHHGEAGFGARAAAPPGAGCLQAVSHAPALEYAWLITRGARKARLPRVWGPRVGSASCATHTPGVVVPGGAGVDRRYEVAAPGALGGGIGFGGRHRIGVASVRSRLGGLASPRGFPEFPGVAWVPEVSGFGGVASAP